MYSTEQVASRRITVQWGGGGGGGGLDGYLSELVITLRYTIQL